MIAQEELPHLQHEAYERFRRAGLVVTATEIGRIEVADFGLGRFAETGLSILVYVNTQRCCAKELALAPHQTCPEHRHPPLGDEPGKEETFRCRWGRVYLYVEGPATVSPHCQPPAGSVSAYTVWHEIELGPGGQHTILPGIRHWFQAGADGAVLSEFSTRSTDEKDVFTDPSIRRSSG